MEAGVIAGKHLALDSCSIMANVKENNLKNPVPERFDKTRQLPGDPDARMGVIIHYPHALQTKIAWFWGYRNHILNDAVSELPLYEKTLPANHDEKKQAVPLLREAREALDLSPECAIGDANYDPEEILSYILSEMKAEPVIPRNRRNIPPAAFSVKNGIVMTCPPTLCQPWSDISDHMRLRRRRPVPQRAMRPDAIVGLSPGLHKHLRLVQRVQHLSVQKLIPHLADERLDIAILPRASRLDEQRRHVQPGKPLSDSLSRELRAIIRSDIFGQAFRKEQLIKLVQDIPGPDLAGRMERETLPGVFVDFRKLKTRGMKRIALCISDAHAGIQGAVRKEWLGASWQRCKVHFMRNILAKVPHKEKSRFAAHLKQIWLEPDKKSAKRAAAALIDDYGKRFPDAVRCLEEGLEDSLCFYDFPEVDKKRISSTNGQERLNWRSAGGAGWSGSSPQSRRPADDLLPHRVR